MPKLDFRDDGTVLFTFSDVNKGLWSFTSPASAPDSFATQIDNLDLPGGVVTSMPGDGVNNDVAYDAASTVTLHCDYKSSTGGAPVNVIGTSLGKIITVTGTTATVLRPGFSTAAGIWWSHVQYGTDLFIANPTDGVWRYDNNTLVPIGAKPIAQMESDEAALWAGETADTTNYKEGVQAMYVESTGAQTTMTFTPASNFNAVAGRLGAINYETDKSPGTDFYHFWVLFTNTGTVDTTNTRLLLTDGDGDTLNFPMTVWLTSKSSSGTAITATPTNGTWYEIWCEANDGTETLTFDATNIDTFAFAVDTSAGTRRMIVDDFYVVYAQTMPAVQILAEWKNILFGFNGDTYYFSPAGAPDEYDTNANDVLKSGGDAVTGVKMFFNQLTVGMDSRVVTLSGSVVGQTYPQYEFDINEVTDEFGISSHRSIVKGGNKLWWFWKQQICSYNGTSVTKVSYPLDVYFTVDENAEQFVIGAPYYKRNQLWWTWRRSGQSANDRVIRYDLQLGAWLPVTGLTTPTIFRTTASGAEKLLTIDETSRKIYAQDHSSNLSFVGTSVEYALELPACYVPATSISWILAWLMWQSNTGAMTVQYRQGDTLLDLIAASYSTAETVTMTAAGEYGKEQIGERSVWLQIKFASSGTKMQLQPPFIVRGRVQPAPFIRNTP